MDKTEARYGEIARLMAETGEWVVLQIDYGIPFGQNPLIDLGLGPFISLFGTHEFFVRLPYLLACLGVLVGATVPTRNVHLSPRLGSLFIARVLLACGVVSTDTF